MSFLHQPYASPYRKVRREPVTLRPSLHHAEPTLGAEQ
jgi:hypothetical protein